MNFPLPAQSAPVQRLLGFVRCRGEAINFAQVSRDPVIPLQEKNHLSSDLDNLCALIESTWQQREIRR
jgi:hypothetical protein